MSHTSHPHPTAPSDAGSSIAGLSPAPDSAPNPDLIPPPSTSSSTPAPAPASTPAPPSASASADAPATANVAPPAASSRPGVTILAPGEEPPASLLASLSSELNPRSCITCRRRKVRCDKFMPCSNCRRNQIQCVFPAPGRAPRRPRLKDPNAPIKNPSDREAQLLKRLRKLESVVEELSGQLDAENLSRQSVGGSPDTAPGPNSPNQGLASPVHGTPGSVCSARDESTTRNAPRRSRVEDAAEGSGKDSTLNNKFGRLVLSDKAKGQYVANAFWSKLTQQIDEIRHDAHSLSEDSEYSDGGTPESFHNSIASGTDNHDGFFFGYRSSTVDLSKLRPRAADIPFLWKTYCTNVEPVVKVIHVPTWSVVINQVQMGNTAIPIQKEAMLFAFYFAAITSLEDEEIEKRFNASKERLLNQYRFAFEQSLAKAEFLTVPDLTIINALALFLTVVRTSDDSRYCWTMTAVAVRLAEALGLQRDGTNFNLTPYEVEMRRRIWWTICAFDLRASEESGTDSSALVFNCDTKMPANINDVDFGPESSEIVPCQGTTDISLVLVRHEITKLCRRMIAMSDRAPVLGQPNALQSIREREETLVEMHRHIETTYLQCPEMETNSCLILAAMIVRVVVAKMSLVIYQPLLLSGSVNSKTKGPISKDSKHSEYNDRVYMAAVEIIECNVKLHTQERFRQWRWLFATYTQWHAIAFVLMEVSHRPWSANMERGWDIVTRALNQKEVQEFAKKPNHMTVWLPLRKLIAKASRNRNAEIERLKANPMEVRKLDMEDRMISSQSPMPIPPGNQAMHRAAAPPVVPSHMQPHQHQDDQRQSPHIHGAPPNDQQGFGTWEWSNNYPLPATAPNVAPTPGVPTGGVNVGGMFISDDHGMEVDEEFNWESWEETIRNLNAPQGLFNTQPPGLQ
ncbi:Bikaverin cluster transcription factor bik5 [Ceratocystis fimbriata CBS 114723]|uniref:Bikaverin cluster transcription factor bik5 n=1 Tax=Ceratocystis fimbriata CBS 114723 TaxID=1035309 RepID=A0A2C5WQE5_9PEZI|nr:Bikaverin cluster transcription factor bik5 [Ceratocystis fimbriata CBS 114723]